MRESSIHSDVIGSFREFLRGLPDIEVESAQQHDQLLPSSRDLGFDARFDIAVSGKPMALLVQVKSAVFPRDARERLWDLKHRAANFSNPNREIVPIIAAEAISPGAKDLLKSEKIGYYDTGGSFFLAGDHVYILVDRPSAKPVIKVDRYLFSNRRAQVVHVLLANHEHWVNVKELASEASVSAPTASQVLTDLERFDWLIVRGSGPNKQRKLSNPGALLDAWAMQIAPNRPIPMRRFFVPSVSPERLAERIDSTCAKLGLSYAITQELAAQLYAPFLSKISHVQCRLPLEHSVKLLLNELSAREVHEGSNLSILQGRSNGQFLFKQRVQNLWLASPILVYLDLLRAPGRAKDMAQHLRHERIGF